MESNTSEQPYLADDLSEPHFDEEATVASARPVVPLEEIRAASSSRKRITFGLAILAALIIGALGATFVYKQRNPNPEAAIVDTAVTETEAKPEDLEQAKLDDLKIEDGAGGAIAEDLAEARDSAPVVERAPGKPVVRKAEVVRNAEPVRPRLPEVDSKEIRRAERKEARRLRRAERLAGREGLGRRRQTDDVLRIREIFEGSRRP